MDTEINRLISPEALYSRTGTQKQIFNSIYQLYAIKKTSPELLQKADRFLMVPEYLNFLLTGIQMNEYTNATTTGLVNAHTRTWDQELLESLAYPPAFLESYKPQERLSANSVLRLRDRSASTVM